MGHPNTVLVLVSMLTPLARPREERYRELIISALDAHLLGAHQHTHGDGACVDPSLLSLTTNLLPTMPASFLQEVRDILTGDDHSSIGGLDGVQSIAT